MLLAKGSFSTWNIESLGSLYRSLAIGKVGMSGDKAYKKLCVGVGERESEEINQLVFTAGIK